MPHIMSQLFKHALFTTPMCFASCKNAQMIKHIEEDEVFDSPLTDNYHVQNTKSNIKQYANCVS